MKKACVSKPEMVLLASWNGSACSFARTFGYSNDFIIYQRSLIRFVPPRELVESAQRLMEMIE